MWLLKHLHIIDREMEREASTEEGSRALGHIIFINILALI